jgi:hypothetical protein
VDAFVADPAPDAYEKLVDRLLASPHYGERWGRHWLDVAGYADSEGYANEDAVRPDAWKYRDYVIRSFNADKPFDQFLREQLAGDEIDPSNQEMLVAAGFHRLGPLRKNAGNQDGAYNRNEILIEMTNVIGSGLLGVTLGCARCHDHKFDPIRQKDYYRMQAFFERTTQRDIPLATAEQQAAWKQRNERIEKEIKALEKRLKPSAPDRAEIEAQLAKKQAELDPPLPVLQTVEDKELIPVHVLERGDSSRPGDQVGMRPLGILLPDGAAEWPDDTPSPRLALAKWITERGVRMVVVVSGGPAVSQWDAHDDIEENHLRMAAQTDKPVAGLLKDLKQRGLLDSTLVVWGGEFGRTPEAENGKGRDHNNTGFTMWMAGGGVRGGTVAGATDDIGLRAIDQPHHLRDIHCTVLRQLGLDQNALSYLHQGRRERLAEIQGEAIQAIV